MSGRGTRAGSTWSAHQREAFARTMADKRAKGWSNATGLRGNADKIAKFEGLVRELRGEVDRLNDDVRELNDIKRRMIRLERSLLSTVVRETVIARPNTPRFS